MTNLALSDRDAQRFWAKVDKTETCWNWTAGTTSGPSGGYGQMKVAGRKVYAHRISFQMAHGSITPEQFLDHTCHNRACVNPAHLSVVTNKQNHENRAGAQRNSKSGVRGVVEFYGGRWLVVPFEPVVQPAFFNCTPGRVEVAA